MVGSCSFFGGNTRQKPRSASGNEPEAGFFPQLPKTSEELVAASVRHDPKAARGPVFGAANLRTRSAGQLLLRSGDSATTINRMKTNLRVRDCSGLFGLWHAVIRRPNQSPA
jgi:hypothetical protein